MLQLLFINSIICVIAFLIRLYPRLKLPLALCYDTYYHLYCAKEIEGNRHKIPKKLKQLVLSSNYSYPYLYHFLLSIFKGNRRLIFERISSPLFDTCLIFSSFIFEYYLLNELNYSLELAFCVITATTSLFCFSPLLLRLGYGPRAYNGSPRILGQLLYYNHLFTFIIAYANSNYLLYFISILLGGYQFVTTKFGVQVYLFFGLVFGLFFSKIYFIIILTSFILVNLLTLGKAYHCFLGHIHHSLLYFKVAQKNVLEKNNLFNKSFSQYFAEFKQNVLNFESKEFINWLLTEPFFFHVLVFCFPFIFLIPNLYFWLNTEQNVFSQFMFLWSILGLIWFFITKIKFLLFIGEAERYLEYSYFPLVILSTIYLFQNGFELTIFIYLIISIVSYFYYQKIYLKTNLGNSYFFNDAKYLFSKNCISSNATIFPIVNNWEALYFSDNRIVSIEGNVNLKMFGKENYDLLCGNYPFPSFDLDKILEKFNIDYIFSDKGNFNTYIKNAQSEFNFDISKLELVMDASTVVLYKVIK